MWGYCSAVTRLAMGRGCGRTEPGSRLQGAELRLLEYFNLTNTNTADTNGVFSYLDTHTADFTPRFYRTVLP